MRTRQDILASLDAAAAKGEVAPELLMHTEMEVLLDIRDVLLAMANGPAEPAERKPDAVGTGDVGGAV